MKHPGPWTVELDYVWDANEEVVCSLPDDPETRAILTHAAEMWAVHQGSEDIGSRLLVDKIEAEIAAAKGDGT